MQILDSNQNQWSFLSLEEDGGLNDEYSDSAIGFDGSLNTLESLCAEQHDTSNTHEIDILKSMISGDLNGLSYTQSPQTEKGDLSDQRFFFWHRGAMAGSMDGVQIILRIITWH